MENEENKQVESQKQNTPNSQRQDRPAEKSYGGGAGNRGWNVGRFIWGIFIIFLGLVLLAENSGLFPGFDVGDFFSRFWPVVIIIIGLSILARGGWIMGMLAAVLALGVLALIALALINPGFRESWSASSQVLREEPLFINKAEGINLAEINLDAGAGKIMVTAGSEGLVSGSHVSNFTVLKTDSRVANGVQRVNIWTEGNFSGLIRRNTNNLEIMLGTGTPVRLNIDSGASDMDLDLSGIAAETVDIDTGASSLDLVLDSIVEKSLVSIDAGASSINISLPSEAGARLVLDAGLSSKNISNFRDLGNGVYETENFASAAKKIELSINAGVSSVTVSRR